MKKWIRHLEFTAVLILLALILVMSLFWGLGIGTVKIPLDTRDFLRRFFGRHVGHSFGCRRFSGF